MAHMAAALTKTTLGPKLAGISTCGTSNKMCYLLIISTTVETIVGPNLAGGWSRGVQNFW